MGPGPSDVPRRDLDASARQTIGHLDPFFITLMDEIKVMLQQAYKTDNALTMPVSAPGSSSGGGGGGSSGGGGGGGGGGGW